MPLDFMVRRDGWSQTCFVESETVPLAPGQVRFRVDRFALTSNNVSYAAVGDMLDYWGFFPAPEGFGRVPAMGYADVSESEHPDVPVGQRVFGFFPMSTHLVIEPQGVGPAGYVDGVAHRASHAAAYRQYAPVEGDPTYARDREDQTLLLRGLFMTSFLVDDFIADSDFYGATQFVIGSASSKTGIALADLLVRRGGGPVIGLTSARNREFVEKLGFYDRVLLYDDVESLAQEPTVFVDHSGNGDAVNALHRHLNENVRYSCIVGATHVGASPRSETLPGAEPSFFFAPAQMQKRAQDWGPQGFQERVGAAWVRFRDASDTWLHVVRGRGPEAVERTWAEVLDGRARPDEGHVLSLHE
jgi:NADPH:quinone reductase-like Zn-dependent oxidoreductase